MEPLVGIQARIDEQVDMIMRRFNLGPLPSREAALKPDARKPENVVTSPETILDTSDLSPPLGSSRDYDAEDMESFTQPGA